MNDFVLLGKALSDPTRVRILAALIRSELCVCELADAMELRLSTLSTHLQTIRQAAVISTRREGKWIYYALNPEHAALVRRVFEHFADALAGDRRLQRDAKRIDARLKLREDGCCLLGFGQLDKKGGDVNDKMDSSSAGALCSCGHAASQRGEESGTENRAAGECL
jgi:DNA-binding transcriptional ArsR family regulator